MRRRNKLLMWLCPKPSHEAERIMWTCPLTTLFFKQNTARGEAIAAHLAAPGRGTPIYEHTGAGPVSCSRSPGSLRAYLLTGNNCVSLLRGSNQHEGAAKACCEAHTLLKPTQMASWWSLSPTLHHNLGNLFLPAFCFMVQRPEALDSLGGVC